MPETSFSEYCRRITQQCEKVIVGKREIIEKVIICFLCSGHILLEDVPGTGKTMLLRAFAATIGGSFKRVQFTPDLLPSDLTGINFYNQKTGNSSSGPARSSPISSWLTRSTVRRPEPSPRCWRPWRSIRSPSTVRPICWRNLP